MPNNSGVEIKGGMFTFMSLKIHTSDIAIVDQGLADKVQQAPGFFTNTPIVIDLSAIESSNEEELDTAELLDCIKRHRLRPIVVSTVDKNSELATSLGLPLIEANSKTEIDGNTAIRSADSENSVDENKDSETKLENNKAVSKEIEYIARAPLLITKPVRSGQQIYARDTDLIIMGQVGPGAEVLADHNVHIYGPLRGRALCGISGNANTRIFCSSLEAELVSVAGNFRMLETIPESLRGKPAQVYFSQDKLTIEPL